MTDLDELADALGGSPPQRRAARPAATSQRMPASPAVKPLPHREEPAGPRAWFLAGFFGGLGFFLAAMAFWILAFILILLLAAVGLSQATGGPSVPTPSRYAPQQLPWYR